MPLIRVPAMQYQAASGVPLAFALAYFTETDTTTPVVVYQDDEYVTPHTNPVVANAQGLFPPVFANPALGLVRCRVIAAGGDLAMPLIDADPVNDLVPSGLGFASITFIADGIGAALNPGIQGDVEVPFNCTIQRVTLLCDQNGGIVVDIWKSTYAGFPPTNGGSITAAALPTIVAAKKYQDAVLTGWDKNIAAGSILRFNINSVATIQKCSIALTVNRT